MLARGLAHDPDARYPDMRALLEALEGPPEKSGRRWVIGALAGLVMLVGIFFAVLALRPAMRCDAPSEALRAIWNDEARAVLKNEFAAHRGVGESVIGSLEAYARAWQAQRQEACEATHTKGEQSAKLLDQRMLCLNEHLARMGAAVAALRTKGASMSHSARLLVGDLPRLSYCEANVVASSGLLAPAGMAEEIGDIQALTARAEVRVKLGKVAPAREDIDTAVERAKRLEYPPLELEAQYWSAKIAVQEGKSKQAVALLRQVANEAGKARLSLHEANALLSLIYLLGHDMGHHEEALVLSTRAEAALTRAGGGPRLLGRLAGNVGLVFLTKGDYHAAHAKLTESVRQLQEAFGRDHVEVAIARNNLALVLQRSGHPRQALVLLEKVLKLREELLGAKHLHVATTLNDMGICLQELKSLHRAEKLLRRALAIRRNTLGPAHERTLSTLNNLAIVLGDGGQVKRAETLAREALQAATQLHGKSSHQLAGPLNTLGNQLRLQGKKREAWAAYAQALANIEQAHGKKHLSAVPLLENLARIAATIGQQQMAFDFMDRAIAIRAKGEGSNHPLLANAYALRGSFYLAAKRYAEARQDFQRQRKEAIEGHGHAHAEVANADYNLALVEERSGALDEASASYQRAITMLERIEPKSKIIVNAYRGLGDIAAARGKLDMALKLYARVVKESTGRPLLKAVVQFEMAKLLKSGRLGRGRAMALAREARKSFVAAGDEAKGNVEEIDAWIKKGR